VEKAASAETEEEQPGECQALNQVVVKKISEICRVVNQVTNLQRAGAELPVVRCLDEKGPLEVVWSRPSSERGLGSQFSWWSPSLGVKGRGTQSGPQLCSLLSSMGCTSNRTNLLSSFAALAAAGPA